MDRVTSMAKETQSRTPSSAEAGADRPAAPKVNWDDSGMTSSYANVVNAASTREEVTLFFGTNQTWNPVENNRFDVKLSDRIVLNPYAAKRLWTLMGAILQEYERRFGPLDTDPGGQLRRASATPPAETATAAEEKAGDSVDA